VTSERVRALFGHIPLVLLAMSFVFDVLSIFGGAAFVEAARFNLVAGLVAMMASAVTDARDYFVRLPAASPARRLARWHALANLAATALFVASLALRWQVRGAPATPRAPFVLSALGVAVLGIASYLGGLVDYEAAATTRRRSPDDR
jgi:uncharacterized membrane protein